MSRGLSLNDLFGNILDKSLIVKSGVTDFVVTLKTKKCLYDEHKMWLEREFESWSKSLERVPGVNSVRKIEIEKTQSAQKPSDIKIYMTVQGRLTDQPVSVYEEVYGKAYAFICKCLAEEVLKYHHPEFDYNNPKFPAGYTSKYNLWLKISDPDIVPEIIEEIKRGPLETILSILSAHVVASGLECFGSKFTIPIRWGEDITNIHRWKVESVMRAFLMASGQFNDQRMELEQ